MTVFRLKYTFSDTDRHGNARHYFRRKGKKTRLPGLPGSSEFLAAYQAALDGKQQSSIMSLGDQRRGKPGSLKQLCEQYFGSREWKALDETTRRRRRALLDRLCARHGEKPFKLMERRHVMRIRDELADTPHGANNLLKAMSGLFRWAFDAEYVERNIMKEVPRIETPAGGWQTWTVQEVRQFEARHPIGTKARLALALLMFTGQRRSDVVRLGRQHRSGDVLSFTQAKNERRKPVRLSIPILSELDQIIAATPSTGLTFLESAYGKAYSPAGFGMRFRAWCNQAGLHHCSAHGLRKAAATIAAENAPHRTNSWQFLDGRHLNRRSSIPGWQVKKELPGRPCT